MNTKKLVQLSNIIGIVSIILLIYWVFIYIIVEVCELKVFRENITQSFYMSISGILALMFGALMVNIMFNLTRIAEGHAKDNIASRKKNNAWLLLIPFPLIILLLFGGDYLTASRKKNVFLSSAQSIVGKHDKTIDHLLSYKFNREWVKQTMGSLYILSNSDRSIPGVAVIVRDSLLNSNVFLLYRSSYYYDDADTSMPDKRDLLIPVSKSEKDYLNNVFDARTQDVKFTSHKGRYELYYPISKQGNIIVLYFSDVMDYGKL